MKTLKQLTLTLVAAAALTFMFAIAGCNFGGSASANSGSWSPYLVLKTRSTAATQVASAAFENKFRQEHNSLLSLVQEAYAATVGSPQCPGIGTILGGNSNAVGQSDYQAASCTGYLYGITADGLIERLQHGATIWYDANDCQGNAWVTDDGVGSRGQQNGAFFTVDTTLTSPSTGTPGTYLMVTAGQTRQSVNAVSGYTEGVNACTNFGGTITVNRFEAVPNISTNSGMMSAQVASGVTAGTP